jgi:hypothetical protein
LTVLTGGKVRSDLNFTHIDAPSPNLPKDRTPAAPTSLGPSAANGKADGVDAENKTGASAVLVV